MAEAGTPLHAFACRRLALEADKKAAADKAGRLAAQLADAAKALEASRKSEAAAKKEADRLVREQLEPQQVRLACMRVLCE